MSLALYLATATALLWLTHQLVRPLPWAAALVLVALPLGLTARTQGKATSVSANG